MKRVMFVDDSPNVLSGLRRMLHKMSGEWEMEFAEDARTALAKMAEKPFDAVVSDMRMPDINGAQLLRQVADLYPGTVRFILSGHSDHDLILQSVGCTHQFLAKPCEPAQLIACIRNSFVIRGFLQDEELKRKIANVPSLPTLPATSSRLLEALASETISIDCVAKIVAEDVGMTAKILQMVNSAFFGLPTHVDSPTRAVSLLGIETIKALVLTAGVFEQFNIAPLENLSIESIYAHSMSVGVTAQKVARKLKLEKRLIDDAMLAGMMHDIGKPILMMHFRENLGAAMRITSEERAPMYAAEEKVMGVSHAEIGAYLLSLWGEPDSTVEAVLQHHHPSRVNNLTVNALTAVHLANALIHRIEYSDFDSWKTNALDWSYLEGLQLTAMVEDLLASNLVEITA
ncbi:MAG: response regulator [Candidatus Zixiibacteriota bacterium]